MLFRSVPGSDYELVIGLRNDGPAALHIDTLYCECTCMQARLLSPAVVDPGHSALVRLVCSIPEDSSDYRKRVLIKAGGQELVLTVTGELPPSVFGFQ